MRRILFILITFVSLSAENPLFNHLYTADPGALVYKDTFYIYAGHDEGSTGYIMHEWCVFSSTDLVHWTDHGPRLKVGDFSWVARDAWASQVIEKNGKFYWYICAEQRGGGKGVGVAVADHPLGPFKDARGSALITNQMTKDVSITWDDIDPTAFVDDDGQAYLYWGNTSCKGVKLKSDMINTDGAFSYFKLKDFTEAPWIHKRNDIYYLSYAALFPEYIDYATSNSPLGPWTHRGRLINERLPSETSHQAIVEFRDKWYIVYHNAALPGGGPYKRSVCIDELYYNDDGTMKPVVMTDAGAAGLAPSPFKGGTYLLTCKKSSKVLEVANSSKSSGANVQQNHISPSITPAENQLWRFDSAGTGVYRIINVNSGLCLGTAANSTKDAANVEQQTITASSKTQRWKPVGAGGNHYAFVNVASGKCLDVLDLSLQDGANVIIYSYLRAENQLWLLEEKSVTDVTEKRINSTSLKELTAVFNNRCQTIQVSPLDEVGYDCITITDLQGKKIGSYLISSNENGLMKIPVERKLSKGTYLVNIQKDGLLSRIVRITVSND